MGAAGVYGGLDDANSESCAVYVQRTEFHLMHWHYKASSTCCVTWALVPVKTIQFHKICNINCHSYVRKTNLVLAVCSSSKQFKQLVEGS